MRDIFIATLFSLFTLVLVSTLHNSQQSQPEPISPSQSNTQIPSNALLPKGSTPPFTFVITADMRNYAGAGLYDTPSYYRGALEALITAGGSDFMVSPGDIDPTIGIYWTITTTLGSDFTWYPVVGNHELPGEGFEENLGDNMNWLRNFDLGEVNGGPSGCPTTTYSFDFNAAHFVILNEYCDSGGDDVTDGDIPDHLYNWLDNDLNETNQPIIFVFGHEPAYPMPDADNGRLRHEYDSLNQYTSNRDRFWNFLRNYSVLAYICGHTHNYSASKFDGVWQIDAGHARGLGDTGAPSTFVLIHINDISVYYETYRDDSKGGSYSIEHLGVLNSSQIRFLPLILNN
jgi:predicted phosphodiesterase